MVFNKKYLILTFFIVLIYAFVLNEFNKHAIIKKNPTNIETNSRSLVYNSTIFSVDNDWYLPQIKNFINKKSFTSNSNKEHYDVRRTPIYPMFYGFHYLIFGEKNSFFFIRFTQIILYALATIALLLATFNFTKNKKIAIISAILFGFNPTLVSYLYFTITEALSASLICFLLYFLSRCFVSNKNKNWFLVGLVFAIGSLCRPSIFFFVFALMFSIAFINRKSFRHIIASSLIFALGSCTLFVPHVIRNYIVTKGDFILLEKYYGDPMDFGLPNIELRNWISCWMNPADYSSEIISSEIINAVLFDSTSTKENTIDLQIKKLPSRALLANKKEDIYFAFASLYDYYSCKYKHTNAKELILKENICVTNMKQLKVEFIKNAPIQYHIITPILFFKSIIFQSNASTLAMLDDYQKNFYKKAMKIILYLLNIFLFTTLLGIVFYVRKNLLLYAICILFIMANITYITFILKYFEVRYLIPIFPCMYILAAIFLTETMAVIQKNYTSK